jgi:hypothetical protein
MNLDVDGKGENGFYCLNNMRRIRNVSGKSLIQAYSIPAKRAYFSRKSRNYEVPAQFPAALCDLDGYIVASNVCVLRQNEGVRMGARTLVVPGGLKSLEGYQRFPKSIQISETRGLDGHCGDGVLRSGI